MATWPTSSISTSNLDSSTDSPANARADLLALAQAVNNIIGHRGEMPGTIKAYGGIDIPSGYIDCNGVAISRTSYQDLLDVITKTITGNVASGNTTINVSEDTTPWMAAGFPVSGSGIPSGAFVTDVTATSIKISAAPTSSSTGVSILVAPWGVGNGTTTFNVPDLRGRAPLGVGPLTGLSLFDIIKTGCTTTTGSASITLASSNQKINAGMYVSGDGVNPGTTVSSVNGTSVTLSAPAVGTFSGTSTLVFSQIDIRRIGALAGEPSHLLSTYEMPAHNHTSNGRTDRSTASGGADQVAMQNGTAGALSTVIGSTGGGGYHNIMQPSALVRYIIKT